MKKLNKIDIERFNTPIDETTIYNPLALVTKAQGSKIWIEGESEPYYDLLMSYSSTNFGHVNPDILKFTKDASSNYDNVIAFNSRSKVELSKKLVELLPYPGNKIPYYPVGGTKAIDAAIKLVKAYTKKDIIIAFDGAFHGYSYAAMTVTDDGYVEKKQFGSYPGKIKKFPFPHRMVKGANQISKTILKNIEDYLEKNHEIVAAIIFEPIQGGAGFIIPPDNFLKRLTKIAQKYKTLTICDEIQTGVCRTGTFYYSNQLNLDSDIILLGKSLAGGYYPLSAVIADKKIYDAVDVNHSGFDSTFATNLFGIEIANKIIDYIEEKNVSKTVQKTGNFFFSELEDLMSHYSFIKELDAIGMAYSYRVESPSGKQEDSTNLAKSIKKEAFKNRLIVQTAGIKVDRMKLAPNFFITKTEIKEVLAKFKKTLDTVSNNL